MKKVVFLSMILSIILYCVPAFAFGEPPPPNIPFDQAMYTKYVAVQNTGNQNIAYYYFKSSVNLTHLNNGWIKFDPSCNDYWMINTYNNNTAWNVWSHQTSWIDYLGNFNEGTGQVIVYSNFTIKNEDGSSYFTPGPPKQIKIISPTNGQTVSTYPSIEIESTLDEPIYVSMWKEENIDNPSIATGKWYLWFEEPVIDPVTHKYTFTPDKVPWTNGKYLLQVWKKGDSVPDKYLCLNGTQPKTNTSQYILFDVNVTGDPAVEILGITEGEKLNGYKNFTVRKHLYPDQVGVIINGDLRDLVNGPEALKYYHAQSKLYNVGINKIELKNMKTNEILKTVNFTLLRDDLPGPVNDLFNPDRLYDDGELPSFNILDPSTWFTPVIQAFRMIASPVAQVQGIFTTVFGWMPIEWVQLGTLSITIGIFLQIIGRR